MWRRPEQDGGTEHKACSSRQSNSLKQVEVETAFQELYSSLLGNKEKVQKSAPTDKHCAHTKPRKDLYNLLALGNVPKSNLINAPPDVLKTGCSILSEHVLLRNSGSGPAITSIYSTEAETSKPPTKRPNLKCTIFPGKAEENLKSDTECPFFARKQPILRAVGSSCKNNENGEDIFELSSDDAISTNSGEDCRETVTCEACSEMFWKVINKKETKKKGCPSGKKQPYDPTSLSCDQWVLKKPLLPRSHQKKLRREISYLKNWIGTSALEVTRKWIPHCSRPHVFLQRNLRSCRRKVDEFLDEHSKKQPKKTRKRSRKKELFVFKLPETLAPSIVISDNEDSEMKISTVKRKLTSAVLSREERTKKGSCDFSDLNSCESGFYSSDSKSVQCKSGNCTSPAFNSTHLNFGPGKTVPAFSISASLCSENQLCSPNEKAKTWEATQRNINSRITPSSFGWLKPGGFTSMIAKLKARSLTSSGSVVKET